MTRHFLIRIISAGTLLLQGLFCLSAAAQTYNLRIEVDAQAAGHKNDSLYVAGNFNNWIPDANGYLMGRSGTRHVINIAGLQPGLYEFKITRGSWNKVQTTSGGEDIPNNLVQLNTDANLLVTIGGWSDDFKKAERKHTASKNVKILDSAFQMGALNRQRRIWIYTPPGYTGSKERYPVLYMHDGQNLFDEATSGFGEWGVDECLDSLSLQTGKRVIVVGIDNGPRRMNEYNPFDFESYGKGEGDLYVDFIATTLKPFIDKHYRTMPGKEHTLIAGSSMGGLISYYAMLRRPDIFGRAGIFSPAFWTAPAIRKLTDSLAPSISGKFFFYMGRQEGGTYVQDMEDVTGRLGANSSAMIYAMIDEEGQHNEQYWRQWLPAFYTFIMADGFNTVTGK